ncbi:MAG TPA: cytochrome c peroxidase [Casimicrobiaceae bacterium]|nr:cytochrome c peroxidase [Casimicrobiaceae bacterium]
MQALHSQQHFSSPARRVARGASLIVFALALMPRGAVPAGTPETPTPVSLGAKLFADPSLSASGALACSTCHDPASAHAQSNALSVQLGGPSLDVPGTRAVPSLRYASFAPAFGFDDEGTPIGGFNRDGRARDLFEQALRPLFSANEMANATPAKLVARVAASSYAEQFRQVFGRDIFADEQAAVFAITFALGQYQKLDPQFHRFDSKYDSFLAGRARLAPAELRGLALFNRADKGNCAACHPSTRGPHGEPPLFTDFSYDNLGVPRNAEIAANDDGEYFDLGLCGPFRTDLADRSDLCGAFKVPTLRNVATRHVFFHNGRFHSLRDALRFYVRRDTNPEEFYPVDANGNVVVFDDLPPSMRVNVNTVEVPYDRQRGDAPRLSEGELDDLEAFLGTLTDGYDPAAR